MVLSNLNRNDLAFVAQPPQRPRQHVANRFFVIHHQDATRAASQQLLASRLRRLRRLDFIAGRKINGKRGPHAHRRLHANVASVFGNDRVRRGQAKATTALFRREVRVEDASQNVGSDPAPIVPNGNFDVSVAGQRQRVRIGDDVLNPDFDFANALQVVVKNPVFMILQSVSSWRFEDWQLNLQLSRGGYLDCCLKCSCNS
jgi:hypothetical protein